MKKILVISDSHGNHSRLEKIIKNELPFDYIIHCGDGIKDLFHVGLPENVKVIRVCGNVDSASGCFDIEEYALIEIEGIKFFAIHGHMYDVKNGYGFLVERGLREGADVVLFGHTHIKMFQKGSPALFNPGPAINGFYGLVIIEDAAMFKHYRIE